MKMKPNKNPTISIMLKKLAPIISPITPPIEAEMENFFFKKRDLQWRAIQTALLTVYDIK